MHHAKFLAEDTPVFKKTEINSARQEFEKEPEIVLPPQHGYAEVTMCKLEKLDNGLRMQCVHEHIKTKKNVWQCAIGCWGFDKRGKTKFSIWKFPPKY